MKFDELESEYDSLVKKQRELIETLDGLNDTDYNKRVVDIIKLSLEAENNRYKLRLQLMDFLKK